MKKFYTIALAAICAFTASAELVLENAELKSQKSSNGLRSFTTATVSDLKAPAKVVSPENYKWTEVGEGKYKASAFVDTYGASATPATCTVYEAQGKSGLYLFEGVWADIFDPITTPGYLIIDATDPNFVYIPSQNTGLEDNVDGITWIASQAGVLLEAGASKEEIIAQAPECVIAAKDGVITFPIKSLVLRWPEAPANSKYETDASMWYLANTQTEGYALLPGATLVEDKWQSLGTGKFIENIMYPAFVVDANKNRLENKQAVDVEVLANLSKPGVYKVLNPLQSLYAAANITEESPEMVFDASNPDNIIIEPTPTGIGNQTQGAFGYFSESYYQMAFVENGSADNTEAAFRITLKRDGEKCTVTFPYHSTNFIATNVDQIYYGSEYVSTLTFTDKSAGIGSVVTETVDGPAAYYNLQGVRVDDNTKGLLIRVQGGKASKVFVR